MVSTSPKHTANLCSIIGKWLASFD